MFSVPFTFDLFLLPRPRVFEHLALSETMAAHAPPACPPQWAARLDALCGHFPFASETDVLRMLTAAQGDTEVVAECLSEYPAARLFKPWCWPGAYDAYGLWRPVPQSEDQPAKFDWMAPDVYFDQDAPPSPGRTRSGRAYVFIGNRSRFCLLLKSPRGPILGGAHAPSHFGDGRNIFGSNEFGVPARVGLGGTFQKGP